jgi:hypothetical protein
MPFAYAPESFDLKLEIEKLGWSLRKSHDERKYRDAPDQNSEGGVRSQTGRRQYTRRFPIQTSAAPSRQIAATRITW